MTTAADPAATLEQKLRSFVGECTEAEQAMFFDIIDRAAAAADEREPEVEGFQANQQLMFTMLTNLANMRHEMLKSVANNLRG